MGITPCASIQCRLCLAMIVERLFMGKSCSSVQGTAFALHAVQLLIFSVKGSQDCESSEQGPI